MSTEPTLLDRLLVPLDGSRLAEHAFPYVRALARPDAEVLLLRVVAHPRSLRDPLGRVEVATADVRRRYRDLMLTELDQAADRLRHGAEGLRARVAVAEGDPAEEVLHAAEQLGDGLVVMTSEGHGAIGRVAFGSVADRVARGADLPVLVVRARDAHPERGPAPIQRIVVPLDGSELAARALSPARLLAQRLQIPVLLLTVVDVTRSMSPSMTYAAAFSQPLYEELLGTAHWNARSILDQSGSKLLAAGIPASWKVLTGPTAGSIMEETRLGDLVVMTSHGRSGVQRWLIGSIAEKLIRAGPAPVILIPARPTLEDATLASVELAEPAAAAV